MSLFGTSPTSDHNEDAISTPRRTKNKGSNGSNTGDGGGGGLFADSPPQRASSSGLFANDADDADDSSPWAMPTPRKQQSRADVVRNLLPTGDVPDSYIETFDTVVRQDGSGGRVTAAGVSSVFATARLEPEAQTRIMSLLGSEQEGSEITLGRGEFNVFLALVGLAQEKETISLDGVDERRRNLPLPKLAGLTAEPFLPLPPTGLSVESPQTPHQEEPQPQYQTPTPSPPKPSYAIRPAMTSPEEDPWNTPDLHKGHAHSKSNGNGVEPPTANGFHDMTSPTVGGRTLSQQSVPRLEETLASPPTQSNASATAPGGWGYFPGANPIPTPGGGFGDAQPPNAISPFGGDGAPRAQPSHPQAATSRSVGTRTSNPAEENITVQLLPEKEGVFMFQHHNYEVSSQRRGSKVVRRYSDFVWLLECLLKRYPFRVLPLLPPKRVALNGNHLSNDGAFIEKRRRGLARFLNAVARHPVLNQEQLVVMFLTVPTELAVWRKQATISVQDEFTDRPLPPDLEDSLPSTLEELFGRTQAGVRRSADLYIHVCSLMDRLVKRTEGVAADHGRVAMSLASLIEASEDTYATDLNEVPLLNDGLTAMSKHLHTCQSLLEDESRGWDEGVLEDLKRQRDALVSVREMFERRERLDKDNIPYLERRIQTNETKLASLRSKPEGTVKAGDIEKIAENIIKDKESIVQQHNRSVFVKECIRTELVTFQSTQYHVSRWNQDWAGERIKYAEMLADNWRRLLDELEGMPLGD